MSPKKSRNQFTLSAKSTLPEDIFSWVQGEYALSLVPDPEGGEPDWVFVAEKTPVRVIELAGQPWFDRLRSLTLSSQGSENGIRRATVFFNLGT